MRRNYLLESWTGLLVLHDGRTMLQRESMLSLARKSRYYHQFPKGNHPKTRYFTVPCLCSYCLFDLLSPLLYLKTPHLQNQFNCHLQSAAFLD